jgi:16S rRNA (cytosine967-C5)-methyltransferase
VAGGARADDAADRRFAQLSGRDRRFATELAYGAVRLRARLDHELEHFVDRPLGRVEGGALDWLRLGLYQLRELRVPDHAALDESVEGARATVGSRVTGFVNAVLRAAARRDDRRELFPSLDADPVGHLTTWGSHPGWLVRRWLDRWDPATVARLVELDNRPPDVTLRILDGDVGEALERGREAGAALDRLDPWANSVVLADGDPAPVLERTAAVVQDPAASAVVDYVGRPPAGPVLDACAAPGGKAVALAHGRGGSAPFVAADADRGRLRRVRASADRTGTALQCVTTDARRPAVDSAGLVLVDAPCTGTGTLRRRPDARWRLGEGRLEGALRLQREILDGCAGVVEPGGFLVYATCSLEPEENEEQVDAFLRRHPGFERAGPGRPGTLPAGVLDDRGDLRVAPWRHGTDGAYAARLRRTAP